MSYSGWTVVELPDTVYITEYYGGASIYALCPCSEEIGRRVAAEIGDVRPAALNTYRPVLLRMADPLREADDDAADDHAGVPF